MADPKEQVPMNAMGGAEKSSGKSSEAQPLTDDVEAGPSAPPADDDKPPSYEKLMREDRDRKTAVSNNQNTNRGNSRREDNRSHLRKVWDNWSLLTKVCVVGTGVVIAGGIATGLGVWGACAAGVIACGTKVVNNTSLSNNENIKKGCSSPSSRFCEVKENGDLTTILCQVNAEKPVIDCSFDNCEELLERDLKDGFGSSIRKLFEEEEYVGKACVTSYKGTDVCLGKDLPCNERLNSMNNIAESLNTSNTSNGTNPQTLKHQFYQEDGECGPKFPPYHCKLRTKIDKAECHNVVSSDSPECPKPCSDGGGPWWCY